MLKGKKKALVSYLAEDPNFAAACRDLKISEDTAYYWKRNDAEFKDACEEAQDRGYDRLEAECYRRAKEGTRKPIYQGGKLVGHVQEYSDVLAIFLMKGARPERYRERIEQKNTGSLTVEVITSYAEEPKGNGNGNGDGHEDTNPA